MSGKDIDMFLVFYPGGFEIFDSMDDAFCCADQYRPGTILFFSELMTLGE